MRTRRDEINQQLTGLRAVNLLVPYDYTDLTIGVLSGGSIGAGAKVIRYGGKFFARVNGRTVEVVTDGAGKFRYAQNSEVLDQQVAPPPPVGNFTPIYPRGKGASEGGLPRGYVYASRWVTPQEAKLWLDNQGTAIPSAVGYVPGATIPRVFVTQQFAGKPPGATGTVRIDFAAPDTMMHKGTGSSTGLDRVIFQPATSTPIYNVRIYVPDGVVIPR